MKLILASEFEKSFSKIKPILETETVGKKAVFIPTAAYGDGWEPDRASNIDVFEAMGMDVYTLDIKDMDEAGAYEALKDSAIISVSGGNSFYLLEYMQKCRFKNILLKDEFKNAFYIGSSASSIVMSPEIGFIKEMDDPAKAKITDYTALGLIDFMFLPHMDHPYLSEAAHKIAKAYQGESIRTFNDDQALYIDGQTMRLL